MTTDSQPPVTSAAPAAARVQETPATPQMGAPVKKKSSRPPRPVVDVFTAAVKGDLDALKTWIIDYRVDPDSRDDLSQTILMRACLARAPEIVSFLLARGAFADIKCGFFGETPLLAAVSAGSAECARLLCENGHVNVNVKTGSGQTPLISAARGGSVDIVRVLLEFGAKVDARDQWGRTALIHAAQGGNAEVVKVLLGLDSPKGTGAPPTASPSKRDNEGRTALHEAALNGDVATIRYLLAAGAKLHRRDMSGATPLDLAEAVGKTKAAEILARAWQEEADRAETERGRSRVAPVQQPSSEVLIVAAAQAPVGSPRPNHGHPLASPAPPTPQRDRAPSIAAFLTPASIAAGVADSESARPVPQPLYLPGSSMTTSGSSGALATIAAGDASGPAVPLGHIEPAEMQSPLVQGLQRLAYGVAEGDGQVSKAVDEVKRVRAEVGGLGGIKRRKDDVKSRLTDLLTRLNAFDSEFSASSTPNLSTSPSSSSDFLSEGPPPGAPIARRPSTITSELRERVRRLVTEARQGVRLAEEGEVLCREWTETVGVGKVLAGDQHGEGDIDEVGDGKEVETFNELAKLLEANLELEKRFQSTHTRLASVLGTLPQLVAAHLTTSHALLQTHNQLEKLKPAASRYVAQRSRTDVEGDAEWFEEAREKCLAKLREYEGRRGSRPNLTTP
ncbi:ankyrin [Gonapodya prolifera JEL478]|uniref:Ankyrin n=1 Tax=Gonapodya prolifera (strain JEL478) TaxID=1344416 RepID=A0A139AX71_GONPJ|nr:ankyrin [Gonapodya prolifera JEL478]|eukprot:KXS21304.1 ankyrin [Gonapodya prolifera JEL478]